MPPRWFLPGFLFKGENIAMSMVREGWAMTYEQADAEYGTETKEEFLRVQAEAQLALPVTTHIQLMTSCLYLLEKRDAECG